MTLAFASACGSGDEGTVDAAPVDAPLIDAAPIDAAPIDADNVDAGAVDAGAADAGMADALIVDATLPDAAPACGCAAGEYCDVDGICQNGPGPLGALCAPTAACNVDEPSFPSCMDSQCASMRCAAAGGDGLLLLRNVCTQGCVIYQDSDGNGVNDSDAPASDCHPAGVWDGPAGALYRCVNHAEPASMVLGFCLPGSDFLECNSSADCPTGEVCDIGTIGGQVSLHCYASYRQSSAWAGSVVNLGDTCNSDISSGPLDYCEAGLCLSDGLCSAYCVDAADCDTTLFTSGQRCIDLKCENSPSTSCTIDRDCSTTECAGSGTLGGTSFSYCTAK